LHPVFYGYSLGIFLFHFQKNDIGSPILSEPDLVPVYDAPMVRKVHVLLRGIIIGGLVIVCSLIIDLQDPVLLRNFIQQQGQMLHRKQVLTVLPPHKAGLLYLGK